MISPEAIKHLKGQPEWEALEAHLNECIKHLDKVSDIPPLSKDDLATETLARIRAIETLKQILEPFGFEVESRGNFSDFMKRKHGV